ncbi:MULTISPECIES: serine/threonine-protein kinase [unclassified Mycoplasma]|uniref:serine/threonine-protein kinase n=1 Tax=unclassified Mycoplasma TaxID=2683645 RepID=UPI00211C9BA2|nr:MULTISPECIES: serine/threonine-protein kinase [unclassified Mycoplasma]UUM19698.1 serine/threonine protein kinase [Mycoplasma sp. 1578d]UUM24681.1 serine/threonine protein kinase [Mycoplasma sp. 3686d]
MQNKYILESSRVYQKYQIEKLIGSGGAGSVFLVYLKANPQIKFALKYYKNAMDTSNAIRFKYEADLLKKIKSKAIPKFEEFYQDQAEMFYVMEYIQGETLSNLLAKKGRLDTRRAINYMKQINEGIGELHAFNIIHRDIKSQNIIVTEHQEIKIVDLGISLSPDSQRITKTSTIVCSPYYAAPEINHKITKAVDIYALGIVFFEMLTGQYPFKGKDEYETIKMHKEKNFPNIREFIDVPWSIYNILARAVAKDPKKRYESVWDFNKDLTKALTPEGKAQSPINMKTLQVQKTKDLFFASNKFLVFGIVIILLIIIVLLIVIFFNIK